MCKVGEKTLKSALFWRGIRYIRYTSPEHSTFSVFSFYICFCMAVFFQANPAQFGRQSNVIKLEMHFHKKM